MRSLFYGDDWSEFLFSYKAFGLDFDGTIVDSEHGKIKIIRDRVSKIIGKNVGLEDVTGKTRFQVYESLLVGNTSLSGQEFLHDVNEDLKLYYMSMKISDPTKNFLHNYKKKIEIISAGNIDEIQACLDANNVNINKITTSGLDKSNILKDRVGKHKRFAYVGDSESDEISALGAGCDFFKVRPKNNV